MTIDPLLETPGRVPPERAPPSSQAFNNYLQRLKRRGYIRRRTDACWELPVARLRYLLAREAHMLFMGKARGSEVWGSLDGRVVLHGRNLDRLLGAPPFDYGDPAVRLSMRTVAAVHDLVEAARRLWVVVWEEDRGAMEALRRQAELVDSIARRAAEIGLTDEATWLRGLDDRRGLAALDGRLAQLAHVLRGVRTELLSRDVVISIQSPHIATPVAAREE